MTAPGPAVGLGNEIGPAVAATNPARGNPPSDWGPPMAIVRAERRPVQSDPAAWAGVDRRVLLGTRPRPCRPPGRPRPRRRPLVDRERQRRPGGDGPDLGPPACDASPA